MRSSRLLTFTANSTWIFERLGCWFVVVVTDADGLGVEFPSDDDIVKSLTLLSPTAQVVQVHTGWWWYNRSRGVLTVQKLGYLTLA